MSVACFSCSLRQTEHFHSPSASPPPKHLLLLCLQFLSLPRWSLFLHSFNLDGLGFVTCLGQEEVVERTAIRFSLHTSRALDVRASSCACAGAPRTRPGEPLGDRETGGAHSNRPPVSLGLAGQPGHLSRPGYGWQSSPGRTSHTHLLFVPPRSCRSLLLGSSIVTRDNHVLFLDLSSSFTSLISHVYILK